MAFGEQPAYLRVAGDLRQKIVDGTLPPHTRLPSQARIREEYGVSDTVALEARKVLMAEGLVEGRSGSGTYVRERPVPAPRRPLAATARAAGSTPFRQEQADEGVQAAPGSRSSEQDGRRAPPSPSGCGIEPGDRVMRTQLSLPRRRASRSMLSTSWEPLAVTGPYARDAARGGAARRHGRGGADGGHRRGRGQRHRGGRRPPRPRRGDCWRSAACRATWCSSSSARTSPRGAPVETADVVVPADRYRVAYHLPVR